MDSPYILRAEGITKTFTQGGKSVAVLSGVNLEVRTGQMVALVGASGSGKSTLLHILGLLERPDAGYLSLGGQTIGALSDAKATTLRRKMVGFVYQFHHLLPEFTALENVALPKMISGMNRSKALEEARDLLSAFGLEDRAHHRPAQLSGGQAQRVAIARALACDPPLLLADEPTGNLDPATAARVFDLLVDQVRARGLAAVIATHNMDLAAKMDRVETMMAKKVQSF